MRKKRTRVSATNANPRAEARPEAGNGSVQRVIDINRGCLKTKGRPYFSSQASEYIKTSYKPLLYTENELNIYKTGHLWLLYTRLRNLYIRYG